MPMNDAFKALSDPTRREIIQLLKQTDLTAGDISQHFDMKKPSISHHLNVLKQADLVSSEKRGQHVVYSLNTTVVQDMMTWFIHFMKK